MALASASTMFADRQRASCHTDLPLVAALASDTAVDGGPATRVRIAGCDLACPYCFAPEAVGRPRRSPSSDDVLGVLDATARTSGVLVVSGGEPMSAPALPRLLEAARERGLRVELETNGTRPSELEALIADGLVDFIALDVKAVPERYEIATGVRDVWEPVERSIATLIASGVPHEFRTTCYPLAVAPDDPWRIAARLAGGERYALRQFVWHRTLDPAAAHVRPYPFPTLCTAAERCSAYLPTVVRGG